MNHTLRRLALAALALAVVLGPAIVLADTPGIRYVETKRMVGLDGKMLYDTYCAACHGPIGRGDGPAAKYLPEPLPDLSTIAAREGHLDRLGLRVAIEGRYQAHKSMPQWGRILKASYGNQPAAAELACDSLVRYVHALQVSHVTR